MAFFNSSNPALTEKALQKSWIGTGETMTFRGTLNKFGFLLFMLMGTAFYTWNAYYGGQHPQGYMLTGAIGGLVVALIITFKQSWAPYLAPAYALLEGLLLGALSAMLEHAYNGLVMQAVVLTFGTVIAMYLLYTFQIIQATEKFKTVIVSATLGIAFFYLIAMVLGFFNIQLPFLHEGSVWGILFSLFVVCIAALNLILDFDRVAEGQAMGAPKHMEWYCAFGLLVTIVWLYVEILRLLSKFASRR
ncbi:MAG: Bax inhibitor-1/YccA family protein [Bacteroidetes bacterium]|nr:Bax inhibitor-1/YccA family protein [Bacteroidota bacterium]